MAKRFTEPDATLIVLVLDESGSMGVKQADVIGGVNQFLKEQRVGPDPARLMILKFNSRVSTFLEASPIERVDDLTPKTYRPSGNTALYDAVVDAITQGEAQRRDGDRVLMCIVTDGEENSSRKATLATVKDAIEVKQKAGEWTFVYLGPDPEKWARETGTVFANTTTYTVDAPQAAFAGLGQMTKSYRASTAWSSTNTGIDAAVKDAVKQSTTDTPKQ